ncbi:hypothetical protein GCM10010358_07060 [Streptomyces minutiscleroticus]|uniref:Uncharacterized protein n=1 Tax=Streptomyces minutiscleroticus TaxID=68238 RepID=A0A918NBA2_9ACTN|nr:hypothetical protein GCM10010358_07060 [Streptomyces minutiscleroticus]
MFVGSGSVNLKSAPDLTMARCFVSPSGTNILPGASQAALCFALSGLPSTLRNRRDRTV